MDFAGSRRESSPAEMIGGPEWPELGEIAKCVSGECCLPVSSESFRAEERNEKEKQGDPSRTRRQKRAAVSPRVVAPALRAARRAGKQHDQKITFAPRLIKPPPPRPAVCFLKSKLKLRLGSFRG